MGVREQTELLIAEAAVIGGGGRREKAQGRGKIFQAVRNRTVAPMSEQKRIL
jgi:hypothetical protein